LFAVSTGVVNVVELLNNGLPKVAAAYQSIVLPGDGVAEIITVPAPQREPNMAIGAGCEATITA
jgi:hypothetical protein